MATFAEMQGNTVLGVMAVSDCAIGGCVGPESPEYRLCGVDPCGTLTFSATEPLGQAMLAESGFTGTYLQCSRTGAFRGCFPEAGYTYDPVADVFVPPAAPEATP
jgi:hypothetical protein